VAEQPIVYKVTVDSEIVLDDPEALQEWIASRTDHPHLVEGDPTLLLLLAAQFALRAVDGIDELSNDRNVDIYSAETDEASAVYAVSFEATVTINDLPTLEDWNSTHLIPNYSVGGPVPPGIDTGIFLYGEYESPFGDPEAMLSLAAAFAFSAVPGLVDVGSSWDVAVA
jgi:hypothetical protein